MTCSQHHDVIGISSRPSHLSISAVVGWKVPVMLTWTSLWFGRETDMYRNKYVGGLIQQALLWTPGWVSSFYVAQIHITQCLSGFRQLLFDTETQTEPLKGWKAEEMSFKLRVKGLSRVRLSDITTEEGGGGSERTPFLILDTESFYSGNVKVKSSQRGMKGWAHLQCRMSSGAPLSPTCPKQNQ